MSKEITLNEATKDFLIHLKDLGKHPRTLYTYGKDVEQMEAFFGADRSLKSILNLHIGKFLKSDELLRLSNGKERAPATVKKTIRVLRMFFHWAEQNKLIGTLPLPKELQR